MWLTNNILREILYKNNTVCCLCFKVTEEDALHVYDEICMDDPDITLEFSNIINLVFENKITDVEFLSHSICGECVKSAISAYKFINRCTGMNKAMTNTIINLEEITQINVAMSKGIYIAADPYSFQGKAYHDSRKTVSSKTTLLKRFKKFVQPKQRLKGKIKICDLCGDVLQNESLLKHQKICKIRKEGKENKDHKQTKETININIENNQSSEFNKGDSETEQSNELNIFDEQSDLWEAQEKRRRRRLYHKSLQRVSCEHCGASLRNKYFLKRHMIRHCKGIKEVDRERLFKKIEARKAKREAAKKKIQMNQADGVNKDLKSLGKVVQSELDNVTCFYCNQSFQSKSILQKHIYGNCKNTPSEFNYSICSQCGKNVSYKYLKTHESSHSMHFACTKCGKVFKTRKCYNRHLTIPNCLEVPLAFPKLEKSYNCHVCGNLFALRSSLNNHYRRYHTDSGIKCTLCEKKFATTHSLKVHMVVHTKEKNFECEICEGRFVSKHSLLYHIRTHSGEKPYKCQFCNGRFLSASRRNIHTRIKHLPPQLECKYCAKKFSNWSGLSRHRRRHFEPNSSLYLQNLEPQVKATTKSEITDSEK